MLRSMFSAISGLKAHQTKLDVTGNNIANVNTVGFKGSQTVFEDTLSQVLRNGSAPTGDTAGTNPAQVGLGVKVAGIATNFSQGAAQNTGRSTDFMIEGDGFFVTQVGNESLYTRAGSFNYDAAGNLVTPSGGKLQGWTAVDGVVNTNNAIGPLTVPFGSVMAPEATTEGSLVGNLSSASAAGTQAQSQIQLFDSLGNAHAVSLIFAKDNTAPTPVPNTWTLTAQDKTGAVVGTSSLVFNPTTGELPDGTALTITPSAGMGPSWPGSVPINLDGLKQFAGKTSFTPEVNGNAMGSLQSISLSGDGTVMGVYSNNLREPIGKLALATFANPGGLAKAGNSTYRMADNSGAAVIGEAGAGGRGTLLSGALEMSNVDLAEEFTGLIVAQRGFQANSRVITTSDEVLGDLIQLKR